MAIRKSEDPAPPHWSLQGPPPLSSPDCSLQRESPSQPSHPPHPDTLPSSQFSGRGCPFPFLRSFMWRDPPRVPVVVIPRVISLHSHLNVFLECVISSFRQGLFTALSHCLVASALLCTSHLSNMPVGVGMQREFRFSVSFV